MEEEMFKIPAGQNPDISEERRRITFNQEELTNLLDGSAEETAERRNLETFILDHPVLKGRAGREVESMSAQERYEYELDLACRLMLVTRLAEEEGMNHAVRGMFGAGLGAGVLPDGNPINLHFVMFLPTLMGQGSPDQIAELVGAAWNLELVGTYAQTELGHGSFIRGLELQAEYDPGSEEFVLNSPTITSFKWWPGGLGRTASHAVVMAQLKTLGVDRGVHPFLVQLRNGQGDTLPGVLAAPIGPKLGMNANDNGYLGFRHHRIPRSALLNKNARVEADGSYVAPPREKLGYATMVFVRVAIGLDVTVQLKKALTIAVRYSSVRRQGEPSPNCREPKILDYQAQQHKLFPTIALAVGFEMASKAVWEMYNNVQNEIEQGDFDHLPELHALSCSMKVLITGESASTIDLLRRACGGHGFMTNSGLPRIFGMVTAACTYEGENTVLQLQIARFLLKCVAQLEEGIPAPPSCSYINNTFGHKSTVDIISDFGLVELFEKVSAGKVQELVGAGAANQILCCEAADAHARSFVISEFAQGLSRASVSPNLKGVMSNLYRLLSTSWILQNSAEFLRYGNLTFEHLDQLRQDRDQLLTLIRPNAVGLVDAFDIRDDVLQSTLGCSDGWVYHRLFQAARWSGENMKRTPTAPTIMDALRSKL